MTFYGTPATGAGWIVPKRIREQATELDGKRREAMLHRIQQLMYDKVMYAPIMEPAILYGVGPRVAESALGLITNMAGCAPYEELRLKSR